MPGWKQLVINLPSSNQEGWWSGGDASLPRMLGLGQSEGTGSAFVFPHNSSENGMLSDSLTTSRTHKLAALSLAESSSRSSCPDRAGSCFEMWQEARAAQRCAGFSLHNPLTRNPDVLGHSFHSPGPAHHPAVALIVSETPLSTETTNFFSFFPSWTNEKHC